MAVRELDSDDAVYILEDLEPLDREDILSQIPFQERILAKAYITSSKAAV